MRACHGPVFWVALQQPVQQVNGQFPLLFQLLEGDLRDSLGKHGHAKVCAQPLGLAQAEAGRAGAVTLATSESPDA